jgi:HK97 family phage major capsid protein/HK97 family phage prohead protease
MLTRGYSTLEVKSVDDEQRIIEGVASTPVTDRVGDILEPEGAEFKLPLPLLWQHRSDQPIGQVLRAKVTKAGIEIRAQIAKGLLPEIDRAWTLIKSGLVRGLSVGFNPIEYADIAGTYGMRFTKWEWLELSAVTVPANADATISLIKSLDADALAATGAGARSVHPPGASGVSRTGRTMKTISEQLTLKRAELKTKTERLEALRTKADGETLDAAEVTERGQIVKDLDALGTEIAELTTLEKAQAQLATPVVVTMPNARPQAEHKVEVKSTLPPGIEFARYVICKMAAHISGGTMTALEIAKARYPDFPRIQMMLKAAVTGHTTADGAHTGGTDLVYATNLASEFVEFLMPQTILGKFGTNGIPSLRRIPFNVRITGQTSGGTAAWVGQAKPKPLTKVNFTADSLTWAKVAAITVMSDELARFSSPSAETLLRDMLTAAIIERLDTDFVNPGLAAVPNVSPASITNGIVALTESGTDADAVRADIGQLVNAFIMANNPLNTGVFITSNALALQLSLMRNAFGQKEFPDITMNGGRLEGFPVIASQYCNVASPAANYFILANASDIYLADDGGVSIDVSREASLEMSDDPEGDSGSEPVSLWQTNQIGLRAERYINWARRRPSAVAYFDSALYSAVGSP